MQELDDIALLQEYVERDSEQAFATLVERHINKVYSVALRQTRNPHEAEEITQAVFVILASKARQLHKAVILSGWLYETARLTSLTFIRSEMRRARREMEAHMQTLPNETEPDVWPQVAPLLDAAMGQLNETDRHAVVLRFFDGKSMRDVGAALGASEQAAKKRVNRAVEKLRMFFTKRGVVVPGAILTAVISANSVQAAPAVLAKTATAVAITKGTTASASTLTLIKGALKIMAWTKMKTAVVVGAAVILTTGTTALVIQQQRGEQPILLAPGQTDFPKTSWAFAGYSDPQSAFLSALWARSTGDFKTYLASLTPEQSQREQADIQRQRQITGKSQEAVVAQIAEKDFAQTVGFRVLNQVTQGPDRVVLHIHVQGDNQNVSAKVKKIGNEWKFDGFERTNRSTKN